MNNILDSGKVEVGELEVNPVTTSIYDIFEKIWGVSSELIRMRNIQGQMKIQKNLPKTLMIDHYRLTQILLNLVVNAIKFTKNGMVEINVSWIENSTSVSEDSFKPYPFYESDEQDEGLFEKESGLSYLNKNVIVLSLNSKRISRGALQQSQFTAGRGILKILVSDTGCGMSEEEMKKLFTKFTQITSDPAKKRLGTGLGLFITKQLCQKMHGDIKSFSKKGKGSTFTLCIPADIVIQQENQDVWSLNSLKTFVMTQNLKAMIVDDILFNHKFSRVSLISLAFR